MIGGRATAIHNVSDTSAYYVPFRTYKKTLAVKTIEIILRFTTTCPTIQAELAEIVLGPFFENDLLQLFVRFTSKNEWPQDGHSESPHENTKWTSQFILNIFFLQPIGNN